MHERERVLSSRTVQKKVICGGEYKGRYSDREEGDFLGRDREVFPDEGLLKLRPKGKWNKHSVEQEGGNILEAGTARAKALGMRTLYSGQRHRWPAERSATPGHLTDLKRDSGADLRASGSHGGI